MIPDPENNNPYEEDYPMGEKRIDWHAGFVSAMRLELIDNESDLEFHEETVLETKKQRIDLLIIKADHTVRINW